MFFNAKGPNQVRIEKIHRMGSRLQGTNYADVVFSQNDGKIIISVETNGRELDKISFSKRDLNSLVESFKKKKDFVFSPMSAGGKKLKFRLYSNSRDFGIEFPSGEDLSPEVDDFEQAFEKMQATPTDLYQLYPEIAKVVDSQTAISDKVVWALSFRVNGKSSKKDLLRYRGEFPFMQLMNLKNKIGIKLGVPGVKNGMWTEFSEETSMGTFELIEQHTFDFAHSYDIMTTVVDGFFQASHYFINGTKVSKDMFDYRHKHDSKIGDVAVAINDRGGPVNDSPDFFEMPTVSVYRQKLEGPYASPFFEGSTALGLYLSNLKGVAHVLPSDKVICPNCGQENCSRHRISKGDLVYINRKSEEDLLFAFEAIGLTGNATDALIPFAPAIIGRKVLSRSDWPAEVVRIEINGVDVKRNLCSKSIRRSDNVKIVIK